MEDEGEPEPILEASTEQVEPSDRIIETTWLKPGNAPSEGGGVRIAPPKLQPPARSHALEGLVMEEEAEEALEVDDEDDLAGDLMPIAEGPVKSGVEGGFGVRVPPPRLLPFVLAYSALFGVAAPGWGGADPHPQNASAGTADGAAPAGGLGASSDAEVTKQIERAVRKAMRGAAHERQQAVEAAVGARGARAQAAARGLGELRVRRARAAGDRARQAVRGAHEPRRRG